MESGFKFSFNLEGATVIKDITTMTEEELTMILETMPLKAIVFLVGNLAKEIADNDISELEDEEYNNFYDTDNASDMCDLHGDGVEEVNVCCDCPDIDCSYNPKYKL